MSKVKEIRICAGCQREIKGTSYHDPNDKQSKPYHEDCYIEQVWKKGE